MSWLKLQTVVTFAKLNPSWKIKVWWREAEPVKPFWATHEQRNPYTGRDYFDQLATIPGVEICKPEIDLDLPDVPFSDYLRWHLLAREGGFWSDFDIIYTRPMTEIGEMVGPVLIQYPCGVWPIGFLGAPDHKARWFFSQIERMAEERLRTLSGYQDIGCIILDRFIRIHRKVTSQPMWVYPEYKIAVALTAYFDHRAGYTVPAECIGFHWYAGAEKAAQFENSIDPDNLTDEQRKTAIIRAIESV